MSCMGLFFFDARLFRRRDRSASFRVFVWPPRNATAYIFDTAEIAQVLCSLLHVSFGFLQCFISLVEVFLCSSIFGFFLFECFLCGILFSHPACMIRPVLRSSSSHGVSTPCSVISFFHPLLVSCGILGSLFLGGIVSLCHCLLQLLPCSYQFFFTAFQFRHFFFHVCHSLVNVIIVIIWHFFRGFAHFLFLLFFLEEILLLFLFVLGLLDVFHFLGLFHCLLLFIFCFLFESICMVFRFTRPLCSLFCSLSSCCLPFLGCVKLFLHFLFCGLCLLQIVFLPCNTGAQQVVIHLGLPLTVVVILILHIIPVVLVCVLHRRIWVAEFRLLGMWFQIVRVVMSEEDTVRLWVKLWLDLLALLN
mmetsp:Transcript_6991/g.12952  ORF Transcript_6991/g.12952 Transcript_6991/m.12952 type:complete len:361 (-) Transcript_6991:242-1324(-)